MQFSPKGLGKRTAGAAALMVANSLVSKVIAFACQIALAWYLTPDEFGAVSLTLTIVLIITTIQGAAIRTVLVARREQFDRLSNGAFWYSALLGLLGCAACVIAAPFAAKVYDDPRLFLNLAIVAIAVLLDPISTVPSTALQVRLKFGAIAAFAAVTTLTLQPATVAFAAMGFGSKSFFLAWVLTALLKLAFSFRMAPLQLHLRLDLAVWRELLADSLVMMASRVLYSINMQLAFIVLGVLYASSAVGYVFFAANLALQPVFLLSANLEAILLPTLASLAKEPERQRAAFVKALRLLALVAFMLSCIPAGAAGPIFSILFAEEYQPAVPLFRVLCFGVPFVVLANSSHTIIQARGRFRSYLVLCGMLVAVMAPLVLLAAFISDDATVSLNAARAMTGAFIIQGLIVLMLCMAPARMTWRELWEIVGRQTPGGAAAIVCGIAAEHAARSAGMNVVVTLVASLICATSAGLLCAMLFSRPAMQEALTRFREAVSRR